jgi:hypothetical protein
VRLSVKALKLGDEAKLSIRWLGEELFNLLC